MKNLMLLLLVSMLGCTATPIAIPEPQRDRRLDLRLQAAAEEVLKGIEERRINGEIQSAANLEVQYLWSQRLAEAECNLATEDRQKLAAKERHLHRMQERRDECIHTLDGSQLLVQIQTYYVAAAELWLAEVPKK